MHSTGDTDAAGAPASAADDAARKRQLAVWALAAGMAVVGLLLLALQMSGPLVLQTPEVTWWALLPVFAVAELLVIHLPTLRNAHTHTLREVPAIVGLAFLSPVAYVTAYVLGSGIALLAGRRQRGLKLAFNVSLFALEAALGSLTYRALLGSAQPVDPQGWGAAFGAVLVTDLVSVVAVTAAISLTEGKLDAGALRDALRYGVPAAMVNTCMALLCVVLVVREPIAIPLLAAVLLMLVLAYRGYVALGSGYSRLQLLYSFVGSTGRSLDLDEAVATILAEARELLRAEGAQLVILPVDGEPGTRIEMDSSGTAASSPYPGPRPSYDSWWAPAALGDPVLHSRGGQDRSLEASADAPPRDGMAAPLRGDDVVYAVLLVTDRTFEGETFSSEDLRLFETLAAHSDVALDKARLVDRLRRLADQREHEARHDALTGLPNRRAFQEALEATPAGHGAVLLVDLDDFKDVNDTLGHSAGDTLLRETSERMRLTVDGFVARLGGDEFAVLLPGVTAEEASEHAHRLLAAISRPVPLRDVNLFATASVGIALMPQHGTETHELLQHADMAMYAAKAAGSGAESYRPEEARAIHRRLVLAGDLAPAVREGAFNVFYQLQADAVTRRIVGVEALLRWEHPTYGAIPPQEAVTLAERTGMLRPLTDAILERALKQRAAWAALGHHVRISVNITPTDLSDGRLPHVVSSLLRATSTPADTLVLEITEGAVMRDPERCLAVLDALAAQGVRLSIDDFGTGYSSLAYLERLPVHEVKIEKSFITRLEQAAGDAKVIRATIALAHDLGLGVVAEGVESETAWSRLAALGCETIQGFALARPMPAVDASLWLDQAAAPGVYGDVLLDTPTVRPMFGRDWRPAS